MSRSTRWAVIVVAIVVIIAVALSLRKPQEEIAEVPQEVKLKAAMVTDVGGLGDESFNDAAYKGLKEAEEKLGFEITVVESKKMDDYEPNLRSLGDQGTDISWAVGFLQTDALDTVAPEYPDLKFGLIDSVVEQPNVASATFKEEEGSFLLGVIAAKMTKTGTVGFVGGMEVPVIEHFDAGFHAGVLSANPDVKVLRGYTGKFDDPAKGKEVALAQFNQGADIIFHASGACGLGVIEAAKEQGEGFWAMGVDSCQHHLAPDNVMSCMMKRVDVAVFEVTKRVQDGTFEPKHYIFGLAEDGVGTCGRTSEHVPEEVLEEVEKYREMIVNGEIVVPASFAELETFTPPSV
ncbi:MAG: BMP family ABC transporter substrate-binding protein [Bacillota bacterium]